jgi:hypothetical protein
MAAVASVLGAFALVALAGNGEARDEFFGFGGFALWTLQGPGLFSPFHNLLKTVVAALAAKLEQRHLILSISQDVIVNKGVRKWLI